MQIPIAQQHPPVVEANQDPLYEQTSDPSEHADFHHSNKQENSASSPNLPADKINQILTTS